MLHQNATMSGHNVLSMITRDLYGTRNLITSSLSIDSYWSMVTALGEKTQNVPRMDITSDELRGEELRFKICPEMASNIRKHMMGYSRQFTRAESDAFLITREGDQGRPDAAVTTGDLNEFYQWLVFTHTVVVEEQRPSVCRFRCCSVITDTNEFMLLTDEEHDIAAAMVSKLEYIHECLASFGAPVDASLQVNRYTDGMTERCLDLCITTESVHEGLSDASFDNVPAPGSDTCPGRSPYRYSNGDRKICIVFVINVVTGPTYKHSSPETGWQPTIRLPVNKTDQINNDRQGGRLRHSLGRGSESVYRGNMVLLDLLDTHYEPITLHDGSSADLGYCPFGLTNLYKMPLEHEVSMRPYEIYRAYSTGFTLDRWKPSTLFSSDEVLKAYYKECQNEEDAEHLVHYNHLMDSEWLSEARSLMFHSVGLCVRETPDLHTSDAIHNLYNAVMDTPYLGRTTEYYDGGYCGTPPSEC